MLKKVKNIVKNLLAISYIRYAYEGLTRIILEIFASNRLLATVYGVLGLITFNREQYAVLRARRNYYRNIRKDRLTHVELRRNIHRIEKGMIMQPRRPIFAKDYIGETIEFYEYAIGQCKNKGSMDPTELQWAHDVLERYFDMVEFNDKLVNKAHIKFKSLQGSYMCNDESTKAPYLHKDIEKSNIGYDDLLKLAMQRRSVRWFKDKKVSRKLIDKALLVARQAPSACNRLPYEFRVFDDPSLAKKVSKIPFGAGGYSHQIPTIIAIVGKLDNYFSPRDRHTIYIDSSLAAMSFMFALETLGVSSCVINWPDFEPLEMKMQKTLGLDASDRVVMMLAVGYADPNCGIPYSQKKELDVIRSYNEISKK